jgi:hypothetical protein
MMRAPLEEAENKARDVARFIKAQMPSGWGFCLILASHGDEGSMTYLSSLDRECTVKLLREMALKLENNERTI